MYRLLLIIQKKSNECLVPSTVNKYLGTNHVLLQGNFHDRNYTPSCKSRHNNSVGIIQWNEEAPGEGTDNHQPLGGTAEIYRASGPWSEEESLGQWCGQRC